jgi:nitrous oxidase accessory protein NosD
MTIKSPIRIDNDTALASNASSGTGTNVDPYILENWEIDGYGYNYALYIGNTTEYFVVRNCTINGTSVAVSWPYFGSCGIQFQSIASGTANITNCSIYDCITYGIHTNNTDSVMMFDNTIWNCTLRGINIDDGDNFDIESNTIYGNMTTVLGVSFNTLSDDSTLAYNYIESTVIAGVAFNDSWSIDIAENVIQGDIHPMLLTQIPYAGILAYNSRYVNTSDNTFQGIGMSIYLDSCVEVSTYSNDILNCTTGYYISNQSVMTSLYDYFNNIVESCIVLTTNCEYVNISYGTFNNSYIGISSDVCEETTIEYSNFININYGISLSMINDTIITYTNFIDTDAACEIVNCEDISLFNCTIVGAIYGINASNSIDILAYNIDITNCNFSIIVDKVSGLVIYSGSIYDVDCGIYVTNSSGIMIWDINITLSTNGAIILINVNVTVLLNNSFVDSSFYQVYFVNVTNAGCFGNYFYTAEYGDAYDDGNNTWSNETYGGNYWCNYTYFDEDGDGYGEIPYDIAGGDSQDLYPIAETYVSVGNTLYDLIILLMPVVIIIAMLGVIIKSIKNIMKKR